MYSCPLIGPVLSDQLLINVDKLTDPKSLTLIKSVDTLAIVALLNRRLPFDDTPAPTVASK